MGMQKEQTIIKQAASHRTERRRTINVLQQEITKTEIEFGYSDNEAGVAHNLQLLGKIINRITKTRMIRNSRNYKSRLSVHLKNYEKGKGNTSIIVMVQSQCVMSG